MSKKIKAIFVGSLPAIVIATFLVVALIYAWTEPSSAPPSGNVSAPLNVSTTTQYKGGALGIGGLFQTDKDTHLAIFSGNVGIGTTSPGAKLDIQGGNLNVGSATIKGDGSLSTGLNTEKVGGYNATELMASAKVQGCNDCDNDKHVSYSYCFNNDCSLRGDDCDDTNPAIIGGVVTYYCDKDGDGVISSSPSGTTCGSPPAGCTTTPGTDCNDNDADIYPGHAGKSTTDGKDNNCNGQVDECSSSYCSDPYTGWGTSFGGGGVCDASTIVCTPGTAYCARSSGFTGSCWNDAKTYCWYMSWKAQSCCGATTCTGWN